VLVFKTLFACVACLWVFEESLVPYVIQTNCLALYLVIPSFPSKFTPKMLLPRLFVVGVHSLR
jgi:hypothetical protein